jgi:hypothetical protein
MVVLPYVGALQASQHLRRTTPNLVLPQDWRAVTHLPTVGFGWDYYFVKL